MELKEYQLKVLERMDEYLKVLKEKQGDAEEFFEFQKSRGKKPVLQDYCKETWDELNNRRILPMLRDRQGRKEVAAHISGKATVFLATGRKTLHAFENLSDHRLYCRQLTPPDGRFPFPNGEFLLGRAPFSVADETALFQKLGVDWLVVKNAGGQASRSKLEAARALGIKVAMIARPPQPECARVSSTDAALDWIRHRSVLA